MRPHSSSSLLRGISEVESGVAGIAAELFLDPQQLVVLGKPLGPAGSASLDLAGAQAHHQISDEGVLGLTTPVAHLGGRKQLVWECALAHIFFL